MRFDILTLFPDMVNTVLGESIIGRAQRSGVIEVHTHQIRDYSADKHRRVDDTPYGGGVGMVMACQPAVDCIRAVKAQERAPPA
jgi:tRNA (guanine37-N1)-methyltransferase